MQPQPSLPCHSKNIHRHAKKSVWFSTVHAKKSLAPELFERRRRRLAPRPIGGASKQTPLPLICPPKAVATAFARWLHSSLQPELGCSKAHSREVKQCTGNALPLSSPVVPSCGAPRPNMPKLSSEPWPLK